MLPITRLGGRMIFVAAALSEYGVLRTRQRLNDLREWSGKPHLT